MTDVLIRSVVASALGVLALLLVRRASASVRHLVAIAALATTLAVTLLGALVPPVRLPFLPAAPPVALQPPTVLSVRPAAPPLKPVEVTAPLDAARPFLRASIWGAAVWGGVGLLLGLRWLSALLLLARRLSRATPVSGLDVPVPVLQLDICRAPLTAWIGHTVIVLPPGWREWPAERLSIVLRHEMAHVRRGDGWGLLLARLATAVAWPNPLVWWLARESARLTERATDDLVVSEGVAPWRYAETLFAIAQACPATGPLPALGMARKAEVAHRVQMILEPKTPRTFVSRRARRGVALAALALALPVATGALGRQAGSTSTNLPVSVEPTAIANPIAFRLRCKIVRADPAVKPATGKTVATGSLVEPSGGGSDPAKVVTAPDVFTGNGIPAALKVKVGDTFHTVEIRPTTGDDLKSTVQVNESISFKGSRMGYAAQWYRTPANGWLTYPLTGFDGKSSGYQMLIQVSPYKDGDLSTPTPVADVRTCTVRCKLVRWQGSKGFLAQWSSFDPSTVPKSALQILAKPVLATRMGQDAAIQLTGGDYGFALTARIVPAPQGKVLLMLDSALTPKGRGKEALSAFAVARPGEWTRVRYGDQEGRDRGYELFVQVALR